MAEGEPKVSKGHARSWIHQKDPYQYSSLQLIEGGGGDNKEDSTGDVLDAVLVVILLQID